MSEHNNAARVADILLEIQAVKLQPDNPFTWASGMRSPIYCDNRLILSYPIHRQIVCEAFTAKIDVDKIDAIAGVATGGIAHGMLVAHALNMPFIYVRSSAKKHGRQNQIEGHYTSGQNVVVIEDLISTGGSSIQAVEALRSAGLVVTEVISVFSYGFQQATDNFNDASCPYQSLSDYESLIEVALKKGTISEDQVKLLQDWRKAPKTWWQPS